MSSKKIKELLNLYFEGLTSVEDEKVLQKYFLTNEVSEDLVPYKPLFTYFNKSKNIKTTTNYKLKKKRVSILKIAASITLFALISSGGLYWGNQYHLAQKEKETYDEIKQALDLLSININRSTEAITHLNEYEKTQTKILNFNKTQNYYE